MKKYIALFLCVAALSSMHARRGHYRRGGWGGWGPGFGVGFAIPLGGSRSYAPPAPYKPGDPYFKYRSFFPKSDPIKNTQAYQRWLFSNYPQKDAQYWWNYFMNYRYYPYRANRPRSSMYFSIGGGGYPYGYGYPYRYGYW